MVCAPVNVAVLLLGVDHDMAGFRVTVKTAVLVGSFTLDAVIVVVVCEATDAGV